MDEGPLGYATLQGCRCRILRANRAAPPYPAHHLQLRAVAPTRACGHLALLHQGGI